MQIPPAMSRRRPAAKPATAAAMASHALTIGELVCNDSQQDVTDVACRRFLVNVLHVTGAPLHTFGRHVQTYAR